MKRLIYLYIILIGIMVPAQKSDNRFEQAEYEATAPEQNPPDIDAKDPQTAFNTGNPADPTPIDDYLPLLIIVALGLIAWKYRRNFSFSQDKPT